MRPDGAGERLLASGFLKPDNPRHLMRKLRRLFNRARPNEHEVQILRGMLAAVEPSADEAAAAGDAPKLAGKGADE